VSEKYIKSVTGQSLQSFPLLGMNCSAIKSTVSCKVAVAGGTVALGAHQSTSDKVASLDTSHILVSKDDRTVATSVPAGKFTQSKDEVIVKSDSTHSQPQATVDEGGRMETKEPVPQSAIFTYFSLS